MTAPINHRDTDKYPKKITAADRDNAVVKPPAIPECPAAGSADVAYNLSVDADGFVEWTPDAVSTPVQADWNQATSTAADYIKNKPTIPTVPAYPAAGAQDATYVLKVATDGTLSWVAQSV